MLNSTSNENIILSSTTTTSSSPNRSKYEKKFLKKSSSSILSRKPLAEKTKVIGNVSSVSASSAESLPKAVEFEDLFSTNEVSSSTNSKGDKCQSTMTPSANELDLKLALSESLRENEQLCDTVKLLKLEIERLQRELEEQQEYAELYLLSKELIEQQAEEISSLKLKLVESVDDEKEC